MSLLEPGPSQDVSLDLVRRIQSGDGEAWEALYLRYRDQLLLSIRCRLGPRLRSRLESEDILHSVFKDALSDLHRFRPQSPESLNHYLHACVLNKIRSKADYYTAKKRSGEVPLSDSIIQKIPNPPGAEPRYSEIVLYGRLEQAMTQLSGEMREIILLRRIENLQNQEAAQVMGKSPEAASKLYNRALARLAVLMRGGSA
jgi:RNA polymerase sigma-70 factor (ECF subfamily)